MKQTRPYNRRKTDTEKTASARARTATRKTSADSGSQEDAVVQFNTYDDHQASYLETFFIAQLKDIYYAENKISDGLKKMHEAATTEELKSAFAEHSQQTEKHIRRLEKVFSLVNQQPEGKKCEAIEGILKEAASIIAETQEGTLTRDAALIFAAQKVEHYEIASYGGLVQFAITLGLHEAADTLDRTLREEEDTDGRLTEIAENDINLGAEQEGVQYSWDPKHELVSDTEAEA